MGLFNKFKKKQSDINLHLKDEITIELDRDSV